VPVAVTPDQIRKIELPTAVRGYEKRATRELLESAANALAAAIADRDELKRRLDARPAEELGVVPAASAPVAAAPEQLNEIGAALLTAHQAGERLVAEARAEAENLREQAQRERQSMLREAQADAANQVAGVKQRLDAMSAQEAQLRALIADRRIELAEYVHRAVDRLASTRPAGSHVDTLENVLQERLDGSTFNEPGAGFPESGTGFGESAPFRNPDHAA
jgi:cell division initiation protein